MFISNTGLDEATGVEVKIDMSRSSDASAKFLEVCFFAGFFDDDAKSRSSDGSAISNSGVGQ